MTIPADIQLREHVLRRLGVIRRLLWLLLRPRSDGSQAYHAQRARPGPSLGYVLLHIDVPATYPLAGVAYAADDDLYGSLVHKVVEPQLVGVLEFELVVVC